MKLLRFDSVGGASGDMILAALIDAGVRVTDLRGPLETLPIAPFRLKSRRTTREGITGTGVTVEVPHLHPHHDDHQDHDHHHEHSHITLRTIRGIIRRSRLSKRVKALSLGVFQRLAEAEGQVHHRPPDAVHFHEVGAVDSIVDIVGACLALDLLGIDAVTVGPLPEGQGTVTCAHGVMPIPVPATAILLQGHPVVLTDEPYEMVTPTGAALLMSWQALLPLPEGPAFTGGIQRSGTGFGSRTLTHRPNLLRALIMNSEAPRLGIHDDCLVLECNLDDMTPQLIGALTQRLLAAGALDVFTTAVQMKKQRPGVLLTTLCAGDVRAALLDLIFQESTTFGVREYWTRRTTLERRFAHVKTPYGSVRVKEGLWKGRVVTRSPEYDDCVRAADHHGVPVKLVHQAASRKAQISGPLGNGKASSPTASISERDSFQ